MRTINVKYVNHANQTFILQGDNLTYVDLEPLREYEWSYSTAVRPNGMGGVASSFQRPPREIALEVRQRGFTRAQFLDQMNAFHAITEADKLAETPGKLYIEDEYLRCYLAVKGAVHAPRLGNFATRSVSVLAVDPYWCTEQTIVYNPASSVEDTTGKKYNNRYPYRYGTGSGNTTINNTHYAESPAIITIYGACSNPSVTIAGVVRNVNVTLLASERLVIDQVEHTIYTVNSSGTRTNIFNSRNKAYDIFSPIPAGESPLVYSGDYKLTVTLVQQRSEPKWTV